MSTTITTSFGQSGFDRQLKTSSGSKTSKSSTKNMYLPPPEVLATMTKKELSQWRACQRKKRKAEKQRKKRMELRGTDEISKHGIRYDPPAEERDRMSKKEISDWKYNERLKRKAVQSQLDRKRKRVLRENEKCNKEKKRRAVGSKPKRSSRENESNDPPVVDPKDTAEGGSEEDRNDTLNIDICIEAEKKAVVEAVVKHGSDDGAALVALFDLGTQGDPDTPICTEAEQAAVVEAIAKHGSDVDAALAALFDLDTQSDPDTPFCTEAEQAAVVEANVSDDDAALVNLFDLETKDDSAATETVFGTLCNADPLDTPKEELKLIPLAVGSIGTPMKQSRDSLIYNDKDAKANITSLARYEHNPAIDATDLKTKDDIDALELEAYGCVRGTPIISRDMFCFDPSLEEEYSTIFKCLA